MKIVHEFASGVLVLRPEIYEDDRGFFFESYNQADFDRFVPNCRFVQDNISHSHRNVLRGLHYQIRQPQGKLVRVLAGEIFDVAVDLRRNSDSFGSWDGLRLSSETSEMLWIPPGFAHGFLVLSDGATIQYKTTQYYAPQFERTIQWNDPDVEIDWPLDEVPILSAKDAAALRFATSEVYDWPNQRYATLSAACLAY